jgi:hypothetical protein
MPRKSLKRGKSQKRGAGMFDWLTGATSSPVPALPTPPPAPLGPTPTYPGIQGGRTRRRRGGKKSHRRRR